METKSKILERGFTLIELMIVVAIIGVLAGIAIFAYRGYTAKSYVTSALAEITPGKHGVEILLNRGVVATNLSTDPASQYYIGVPAQTSYCNVSLASFVADGTGAVKCTLHDVSPPLVGQSIEWKRDANGLWSCVSSVEQKFLPHSCVHSP